MKEAGIDILAQEEKTLTEEEAREFYSHQQEQVGSIRFKIQEIECFIFSFDHSSWGSRTLHFPQMKVKVTNSSTNMIGMPL